MKRVGPTNPNDKIKTKEPETNDDEEFAKTIREQTPDQIFKIRGKKKHIGENLENKP